MTREEFSEYLKKLPCIETQLVYLRQRYKYEEDWEYLNEILSVDMDFPGYYIWENDWNEGQENVEILGCVPISEIDVPLFKEEMERDGKNEDCD